MKKGLKELFLEEDGIGTVEMILILVVLIAVVAIFKTQLTKLVGELFTKLSENAKQYSKKASTRSFLPC